ncbi:hypothetical protein CK203_081810 [Vitis vinifera]|uniref:DUF4283 domain-containing protein n=1 Tax=Vitis vinifera TaxID=29760 RepID=A0A438EAK6_VITVI|nr:hypothetical protein CK203_081810 [Vitis vinifera]
MSLSPGGSHSSLMEEVWGLEASLQGGISLLSIFALQEMDENENNLRIELESAQPTLNTSQSRKSGDVVVESKTTIEAQADTDASKSSILDKLESKRKELSSMEETVQDLEKKWSKVQDNALKQPSPVERKNTMRESEGDPAREGGEGESRAENRGKRKRSSFVVESKLFEVVAEERYGRSHAIISESKGGVVSWVRLGSGSVGQLIEGLIQCAKEGKDGRWEKGWNEKGRSYSLVRETNRAGSFIRLGVTDMEKRRFGICIPKGKGEKGGWASMVESLLWVGFRREEKVVVQGVGVSGRSYLEVVRGSESKNTSRARIEIEEEEIRNNVSRLKQCLIAKWNPKSTREEELASLGWSAAKAWGLKGKLGLARMGKGCALLEFEMVEEARRVLAAGVRAVGGIQLGLEMWSPSFGCCAEEEDRNDAWVRILGLPISLWVPSILRRVGEECGGFLGIDPLTEKKEELEWARIQVKMIGGALPSSMEIGVEGEIYVVSLWWEIPPAIRKKQEDGRVVSGQQRGKVREDVVSRAGWRVGEKSGAGTKEQRRSDEVTGEQVGGEGGGMCLKSGHLTGGWIDKAADPWAMDLARLDRGLTLWAGSGTVG